MRLSVVQGGGIAPVSISTVADSASLAPEDAEALRAKVAEAGLLEMEPSRPRSAGPEQARYRIIVEHDGATTELAFDDASIPDAVRSLVSWVGTVPGGEKRIEPLGRDR